MPSRTDSDAHYGLRDPPIAANPRQFRVKAGTAPHRLATRGTRQPSCN